MCQGFVVIVAIERDWAEWVGVFSLELKKQGLTKSLNGGDLGRRGGKSVDR